MSDIILDYSLNIHPLLLLVLSKTFLKNLRPLPGCLVPDAKSLTCPGWSTVSVLWLLGWAGMDGWICWFSPAVELNPISQLGELVRQAALLNDSLGADGHLAQGVGLGRRQQTKLVDCVGNHVLGCGVFADDDVAALLVSFEYSNDLVWDVWWTKARRRWIHDLFF